MNRGVKLVVDSLLDLDDTQKDKLLSSKKLTTFIRAIGEIKKVIEY